MRPSTSRIYVPLTWQMPPFIAAMRLCCNQSRCSLNADNDADVEGTPPRQLAANTLQAVEGTPPRQLATNTLQAVEGTPPRQLTANNLQDADMASPGLASPTKRRRQTSAAKHKVASPSLVSSSPGFMSSALRHRAAHGVSASEARVSPLVIFDPPCDGKTSATLCLLLCVISANATNWGGANTAGHEAIITCHQMPRVLCVTGSHLEVPSHPVTAFSVYEAEDVPDERCSSRRSTRSLVDAFLRQVMSMIADRRNAAKASRSLLRLPCYLQLWVLLL